MDTREKVILFIYMMALLLASVVGVLLYQFCTKRTLTMEQSGSEIGGMNTALAQSCSFEMNTPFNAFRVNSDYSLDKEPQHRSLKKMITLSNNTFKNFGFNLWSNKDVNINVSSNQIFTLLVIKGQEELTTCRVIHRDSAIRKDNFSEGSFSLKTEPVECDGVQNEVERNFPDNSGNKSFHFNVTAAGYYHFVFYSEFQSEIHADFGLYLSGDDYSSLSSERYCINKTRCHFQITSLEEKVLIKPIAHDNEYGTSDTPTFNTVTVQCELSTVIEIFLILILPICFVLVPIIVVEFNRNREYKSTSRDIC